MDLPLPSYAGYLRQPGLRVKLVIPPEGGCYQRSRPVTWGWHPLRRMLYDHVRGVDPDGNWWLIRTLSREGCLYDLTVDVGTLGALL
eukprot:3638416-Amphidinium_carterae.1